MQGKSPINWIFDWLGLGSMGENYELLPSVQPVVELTGIEFPINLQPFASGNIALIAGTATLDLPAPAAGKTRVWTNVVLDRTSNPGDTSSFIRTFLSGQLVVLWHAPQQFPTADHIPIVGGVLLDLSGTAINIRGLAPQHQVTSRDKLTVAAGAAAAVGVFAVSGLFFDVPEKSIISPAFLT